MQVRLSYFWCTDKIHCDSPRSWCYHRLSFRLPVSYQKIIRNAAFLNLFYVDQEWNFQDSTKSERTVGQLTNKNIVQFALTEDGDCVTMEVDQAETSFEVSLYAKGLELVWKKSMQGFNLKLIVYR